MTNEQRYRQLEADLREDVLDVLQDAATWRLTRGRWLAVADAVAALEVALRDGDGDGDAVRDLVLELELAGPMRATGIEADPVVSAPETIRPVLVDLVDALAEDMSDGQESRG